uniref:ATP synthase complex subunit 8 n=1 Tax=Dentex angolensis TaxID=349652 RepID=A0A515L5V9_9TELE|nr:ATP synthase F0 subunit 8 [Dentex angolensis]QDM39469.1 ATP synthase F0 subunit 8 [Dentex angolensis]
MPQLNPTPWFAVLMFSWVVFLTILPPKVMAHIFPNDPTLQCVEKAISEPWAWPWY